MAQSLGLTDLLKGMISAFGGDVTNQSGGEGELLEGLINAIAGFSPGGAGNTIVRAFPFAFDTPNILTGAALYTPTVGDILLDAWVEIDTAWNGTTPKGDFGIFTDPLVGTTGWLLSDLGTPLLMTDSDNTGNLGGLLIGPSRQATSEGVDVLDQYTGVNLNVVPAATALTQAKPLLFTQRVVPSKFFAAYPVQVVVSQDGTNTGADPGSTQGAAVLYLVTATPTI